MAFYRNKSYKVVDSTGAEVKRGMNLVDFRKAIYKYEGFEYAGPPSSGKLYVRPVDGGGQRTFYPHIFDCKIVEAGNDA